MKKMSTSEAHAGFPVDHSQPLDASHALWKNLLVVGALCIFSALLVIGCGSRKEEQAAIYELGASAPLTGDAANYGRSTRQGLSLAVKKINASGMLDKPLRIVYEDDRMNPRDGVNAVTKLITADKVPLVLGPFGSSVVLAAAPVANKSEVVLLSASATADSIADAGDFVFRIAPPNSRQGADVAEFLAEALSEKTAAVIYQNNDYGVTLERAFSERFQALGGTVVARESVEDGASDVRAQITKIREKNPGAVFFPLHYAESGLFLRQASDLNLDAVFVSADGAMTQDMLKLAGEAAEGSYYTSLALGSEAPNPAFDEFKEAFLAEYQQEPDVYAAYYYDAALLAAEALAQGARTGPQIRDYFYSLTGDKSFSGISGAVSFDRNGEVSRGFSLYVVEDGAFTPLTKDFANEEVKKAA